MHTYVFYQEFKRGAEPGYTLDPGLDPGCRCYPCPGVSTPLAVKCFRSGDL